MKISAHLSASALWLAGSLLLSPASLNAADLIDLKAGEVPFSVIGPLPESPAPTVFVFALDRKTSLEKSSFSRSALSLRKSRGVLCVSLDMPAHGEDVRPGEKGGLTGWGTRLKSGENIAAEFAARFDRVLDHLIREGYTDPDRVAVIGISRGGFMAMHLMAACPRIKAVATIAPALDLGRVDQFKGVAGLPLTQSLALGRLAENPNFQKPLWITVGNHDTIVGTDLCMAFVRAVAAAAPAETKFRAIELHVMPGDGHRQPPGTHEKLAAWLDRELR